MKTVLVAGDLVEDYNLVLHPGAPAYHHVAFTKTVMKRQRGGAWYLENVIRMVMDPTDTSVRGVKSSDVSLSRCASQAYSIWALCPRQRGSPDDRTEVWRIRQFLGCNPVALLKQANATSGEDANGQASTLAALCARCRMSDVPAPDVLVLDDLALGFRETRELWPAALTKSGNPKKVVLKTTAPLGKGDLWDLLLRQYSDRLTVVLSADMLRGRGAAISTALSWDKTIEDTVKEFESGRSSEDLARCRRVVVYFGMEGAISYTRSCHRMGIEEVGPGGRPIAREIDREAVVADRARFERFVYDPDCREGDWKARHPGQTFGSASIMTACIVRHELEPRGFPLFIAVGRALAAMRTNHLVGGGDNPAEFAPREAAASMRERFRSVDPKQDPAKRFCAAFHHELLSDPVLKSQKPDRSDLLRDLTGVGLDYVAAIATSVVLYGPAHALQAVPKARYGKCLTVDREEIERINAISKLIQAYMSNASDRRPLSLAVFGPAGSGKSFAIKELASDLFGADRAVLEFNLSQFSESGGDLHTAFHRVRDAAVHGKIPLVFWDEFDTDGLKWLKYFLAPMQDAEFRAANILHPFGKAIFVFAGGTAATLDSFVARGREDNDFAARKGPDFVSRLRGYVSIKGPNPRDPNHPEDDPTYLIRRAVILRSVLERFRGHLLVSGNKASISTCVISGFLRASEFKHGARSIEAIVEMSALGEAKRFAVAALPARELLRLHVSDDFMDHVLRGQLEETIIEALAEACHKAWFDARYSDGWRYGERRDDAKKLNPRMLPYAELTEPQKDDNRLTARLTQAKLREIGYGVTNRSPGDEKAKMTEFTEDDLHRLMDMEHDIWLRARLLQGYEWAEETNEEALVHRDIAPFDNVPPEDHLLDRAIAESIPPTLWDRGYTLVKI